MTQYLNAAVVSKALKQFSVIIEDNQNQIENWQLRNEQESIELLAALLLSRYPGDLRQNLTLCKKVSALLCSEENFMRDCVNQDMLPSDFDLLGCTNVPF